VVPVVEAFPLVAGVASVVAVAFPFADAASVVVVVFPFAGVASAVVVAFPFAADAAVAFAGVAYVAVVAFPFADVAVASVADAVVVAFVDAVLAVVLFVPGVASVQVPVASYCYGLPELGYAVAHSYLVLVCQVHYVAFVEQVHCHALAAFAALPVWY